MEAIAIAEYVRRNGRTTQIAEDTGDAENGPEFVTSGDFKRLGPLRLYEDPSGVILTVAVRNSPEEITLLDTMPPFPF